MSKRSLPCRTGSKRICTLPVKVAMAIEEQKNILEQEKEPEIEVAIVPSKSTEDCLLELRTVFPTEKLCNKYPPVVFIHQLYNDGNNTLSKLEDSGSIRTFSLNGEYRNAIVYMEDFTKCILKGYQPNMKVRLFLEKVLPHLQGPEVERTELRRFRNVDITELVRFGLLIMISQDKFRLTFPGVGPFLKIIKEARKSILNALKRAKFKELLVSELKDLNLSTLILGFDYHIKDVIGANLVDCVNSTSGLLLQFKDTKK